MTSSPRRPLGPLLQAVVYGDSAYPSGRYTLSYGLEGLIQTGQVAGSAAVREALEDHLCHTAAPGDGVATAAAVILSGCVDGQAGLGAPAWECCDLPAAVTALCGIDEELSATKVTEELRKASTRVGRQTLRMHREVHPSQFRPGGLLEAYADAVSSGGPLGRRSPGNQAIALGLVHHSNGLSAQEAVAVELLGLAVGWSSAALRLGQCDHVGAQQIVAAAMELVEDLAGCCVSDALELLEPAQGQRAGPQQWAMIGRASPGADMASAVHEVAPARLFMS
ncbi:urease accessory protein UreF [Corynebacterium heidelbergense]|uniref:Urease accessory protein UreF n=1 Tax=Corynebacterium heidelbergense TaxID=2055947 RepID=A0A364V5T6_9CORY|nr:urease accessory UreF family protein [Corynebacterium heidelbergense]RAV32020.1 urease accessory protein UreF [Corynebacterium heidelbergense]